MPGFVRPPVMGINPPPTQEDLLRFEVCWLRARIENLEVIVRELLRGRVNGELVDAMVEVSRNPQTFTPSLSMIENRGEQIAHLMDRFPDMERTWKPRDDLSDG